jgi:hypothetical protein
MIESSVVTVLIPEAPIDFFCTSVFFDLALTILHGDDDGCLLTLFR